MSLVYAIKSREILIFTFQTRKIMSRLDFLNKSFSTTNNIPLFFYNLKQFSKRRSFKQNKPKLFLTSADEVIVPTMYILLPLTLYTSGAHCRPVQNYCNNDTLDISYEILMLLSRGIPMTMTSIPHGSIPMQIPFHVDAKYFNQVQNFMTKVSTRQ